jgi:hypothetical protein
MLLARQADSLRSNSVSGIVSGLEVQRVGTTLSLRVLPGKAVIANKECVLSSIYDGLLPAVITNNVEVFVVMTVVPTSTTVLDRFEEQVVASTDSTFTLSVVPVSDYVVSNNTCVLAMCKYVFNTRITSIPVQASVQLPARFFGVFDSLASVNADTVFLDSLRSKDSLAVRSVATTPGLVDIDFLELYSWEPLQDPVVITVIDPETSASTEVSAIWGPKDVDNNDLTPVLHYWLPSSTLPTGQHLWYDGRRSHTWVLLNPGEHGLSAEILADFIKAEVVIDSSARRYAFMRPGFSGKDTEHRLSSHEYVTTHNPHGLGFNDLGYDVMPLHKQIFNEGFGVVPMEHHGIVGTLLEEHVDGVNIQTDYFGDVTGELAGKYVRVKHVPVGVSYVLETTTGNNVAYELRNDVITLGTDFVGGDFEYYPVFAYNVNYAVGSRVIRKLSGITHLYECTQTWPAGYIGQESDRFDTSYFKELFRTDLVVGYYFIPDYEYSASRDNNIYIHPNNISAVISEGVVIDPVTSTEAMTYSLSSLKDIALDKLVLSVNSKNALIPSNQVIDRVNLASKRSGSTTKSLTVPAQLKAYVVNAQDNYDLAPPEGTLSIVSSNFYGRYRLFYTYGVDQRTVFTTSEQVNTYTDKLNLASAQMVEGVNHIPRDSWEYAQEQQKVIIAGDVYVPTRNYSLVRYASESARNRRGFIEVIGTKPRPDGVKARSTVSITEYDRLDIGDSITLTISTANINITKTLQASAGYTGFIKGASTAETYASIIHAFSIDPVFIAQGCSVVVNTQGSIDFVAGVAGTLGNTYVIAVQSLNTALMSTPFAGGAEYTPVLQDIAGLSVRITDIQDKDVGGHYTLWATKNLDSGNSTDMYHSIAVIPDDFSGSVTKTVSDLDVTSNEDLTYDLSQELKLSIQINGTDNEDNPVQETLVFDYTTFCCIQNYRVFNPYAYVRSANFFKTVTNWSCMEYANIGSAALIIVAESASGTQDLFDVCSINWTGARIKSVLDKRRFVDAFTNKPVASIVAEALSNTAAILQL